MKMCHAFASEGHQVELFAPRIQSNDNSDSQDVYAYYGVTPNFQIHRTWWPQWLGRAYLYGLLVVRKIKVSQFDLVFSRCLPSAFYASFKRIPVIFEYHQPIHDSGRLSWLNKLLFSYLVSRKNFLRLVVITHTLEQHFLERYPALAGKIIVAADGADPFPEEVQPAIHPNSGKRLQVGYVGQLYPGKGMEILSRLCQEATFADFHVVGGMQQDINKWKSEIKTSNITFHGFVPHSQTLAYIASFDVVLLPNLRKVVWHKSGGDIGQWTSPLKMFEYMAAAKAIVSSDLPVLAEVLDDEKNALMCSPENTSDWVKALRRLEDAELRKRLGQQARKDFLNNYTWQKRAQKLLSP